MPTIPRGHKPTRFTRKPLYRQLAQVTAALCLAGTAAQVHALSFELDNGVVVDWDTTLTYDAAWRMENQDSTLLTHNYNLLDANPLNDASPDPRIFVTDDGNRNFDKDDMIMNRVSFNTDLDINYGDGGVFLRARGWYDDVYSDDNLTQEKNIAFGGSVPNKTYQKDGLDLHKQEIELLDAFIYHTFDIGERSASARLGRQVVNWGESLFIQGGISTAQSPLDATKANAPGVELKDIFLPISQIYAEMDLTDSVSFGAYYQWEWEKTRIDAPGSYFNVLEVLGQEVDGDAVPAFAGLGSTVQRDEPDQGQYGIALRYLAESLNNTEFGLYHLQYNDFAPTIQFVPGDAPVVIPDGSGGTTTVNLRALGLDLGDNNGHLEHFEDIKLYGASFGTVFGDTNVSGEFSYRDGAPVRINMPGMFYYSAADTLQTQLSIIHLFGAGSLWDNLTLTGEVANYRVLKLHGDALAAQGLLVTSQGSIGLDDEDGAVHGDKSASSAVIRVAADYFNLLSGLDLKLTATYRNDFSGVSPQLGGFAEGTEVLGLKADFTYLNQHNIGISYTAYLTNPDEIIEEQGDLQIGHYNADRDYAAIFYKYSF